MEKIKTQERLLSACAYLFFVVALYIILTDKRKIKYDAYNAAQALLLWLSYLLIFIALRIIYALLSGIHYFIFYDMLVKLAYILMFAYVFYIAYSTYNEKEFYIPYISNLSEKIL
ncbi:hypothetical protein HZC34_05030 [Candidatus Saganbacteria bacterium]|nr:hypothetical protein [Candidatus Saganbacteria bacterium]